MNVPVPLDSSAQFVLSQCPMIEIIRSMSWIACITGLFPSISVTCLHYLQNPELHSDGNVRRNELSILKLSAEDSRSRG